MSVANVVKSWGLILAGHRPSLSIEITRECPLRCPGCYAYGDEHLGGDIVLRDLADHEGDRLVNGVLDVVRRRRPWHVSLVGGEPLVRYRELNTLLPKLSAMGIHTQVVTSAVRPIPQEWVGMNGLQVCVSIDGLRPEHDLRRAPATYDRILKHIDGHQITVHCTVTRQQTRPGYLTEFTEFWAAQPAVNRIWFSLYTPQRGEQSDERLLPEDRVRVVAEIAELHTQHPTLADMRPTVASGFLQTPESPDDCIFAQTTACLSADLERAITPCQFGGDPDCSQCGCLASVGLEALGRYRLGGVMPLKPIFNTSLAIGNGVRSLRGRRNGR